jgi:outer membrane protein TolC
MVPARSRVAGPFRVGWLIGGVCASAWPLLTLGCATSEPQVARPALPATVSAAMNEAPAASTTLVVPVKHDPGAPPGAPATLPNLPADLAAAPTSATHAVPISLDAVLRLAEEHNSQIALARERVHEGLSEQELAARGWIPRIDAGIDYYRHEGGIPLENGRLIYSSFGVVDPGLSIAANFDIRDAIYQGVDSERKVWQQRGELSRVTNETLLEAVNTYFDLLAARRGEQVARDLEKEQQDVLKRAEKLAAGDRSAQVLVEGVQTELAGRHQALSRLHQQGDAAAVKLAYLLGMGPDAMPEPVDPLPTPLDLIDVSPPTAELVARALQSGPGVQELQRLLGVIQDGFARLDGPLSLLPTFSVGAIEGAIASGGSGGSTIWDNRLDVVVGARWNLTEYLNKKQSTQIALSRIRQAQLSLEDLQGKLTAGVREGQQAVLSGRDEMKSGAAMIDHASQTYKLSSLRLEQSVPGSSTSEVMAAIRAKEQAHLIYLNAVTTYNKAQIRLLLLLGQTNCGAGPGKP